MPTIQGVLEPKLTAVQTKLTDLQAKLKSTGVYPGIYRELAEIADEMAFISGLAEQMAIAVRFNAS